MSTKSLKDPHKFWQGIAEQYDNLPFSKRENIKAMNDAITALFENFDAGNERTITLWRTLARQLCAPYGSNRMTGILMEFLIQGIFYAEYEKTARFYKTLVSHIERLPDENRKRFFENCAFEFQYGTFCDPEHGLARNLVFSASKTDDPKSLYFDIADYCIMHEDLFSDVKKTILQEFLNGTTLMHKGMFWDLQGALLAFHPNQWVGIMKCLNITEAKPFQEILGDQDDSEDKLCEIITILTVEYLDHPSEDLKFLILLFTRFEERRARELILYAWKQTDVYNKNLARLEKLSYFLEENVSREHSNDSLKVDEKTIDIMFKKSGLMIEFPQ